MKTTDELESAGEKRGRMIAGWIPMPKLGDVYQGVVIASRADAANVIYDQAIRAEEANRRTPEFEPCRHELDTHEHRDMAWAVFDLAVSRGAYETAQQRAADDFEEA